MQILNLLIYVYQKEQMTMLGFTKKMSLWNYFYLPKNLERKIKVFQLNPQDALTVRPLLPA